MILDTAKKLERIYLRFSLDKFVNMNNEEQQQTERILVELLNRKTLKSITIEIDKDIAFVRDALKKISLRNRESMRVYINITKETENVLEYLKPIENELRENCNNWVMRFQCMLTPDIINYFGINKDQDGNRWTFTSSNDNCMLNGWKDRWLYPCICNQ